MQSLEYSERLVSLMLYSLQRRRERYCIIYVWKIIEGLVPNFSKPIVCVYSEHRGRSCIISHVILGRLGSLAYNVVVVVCHDQVRLQASQDFRCRDS